MNITKLELAIYGITCFGLGAFALNLILWAVMK